MKSLNEEKDKDKDKGISLRTIYRCLVVGAILMAAVMIFFTFHLSTGSSHLAEISEQQIQFRKATRDLMDASDYLTEKVQRFTIYGNRRFLDEYFTEAFKNKRREEAINTLSKDEKAGEALAKLKKAMDASVKLMNREYYAMRLVVEAKGYTDYPEQVQAVVLSDADKALSPEGKMDRAVDMVHDNEYYAQQEVIRTNMRASLDELEKMNYQEDQKSLTDLQNEMNVVRIFILIQTLAIFFMVWLTSRLGIHPVLNAVEEIKEDKPIPEIGANEFRYLARTYNKMYEVYKSSLERLNFKASHDELTGAYNRAGYDLLISSLDLNSSYIVMIDVDNFKTINDTHGHEMGDKVLVKVVNVLKSNFRSDDYVCRMGGDEFVVLVVHATSMQHHLLETKIDQINNELEDTSDGLPSTSISAGIVHGDAESSIETILSRADEALYETKRKGRRGYTFYNE